MLNAKPHICRVEYIYHNLVIFLISINLFHKFNILNCIEF